MIIINKLIKILSIVLCLILCAQISVFAFESNTENIEESSTAQDTEETTSTLTDDEKLINNEILFKAIEEEYNKLEQDINNNQEELDDINSDINSNIQKLAVINSEVDILNNQIKLLDSELTSLNFSIEIIYKVTGELNTEIADLTESIEKTEEEITTLQPILTKATDELQEIIRNEYINGSPSLLEVFFSATTMEEYFTYKELYMRIMEDKAETVETVSRTHLQLESDKKKMENEKLTLQNDKKIIAEYKAQYNTSINKQEATQKSLVNKKRTVTNKKNEIKNIISDLDVESEEYKNQIKKDREEMEYLSEFVNKHISSYGSKLNDVPDVVFENNGQMKWPVNFDSYLSATFPAYSDGSAHWGIDICATNGNTFGRPFNAAQGGKVILATNDNNYNSGFGNYCVVDHGDGTYTLYAHAKNLVVSQGDIVRQGETLGYIGSTGNSTGPHLHFEVRVNNGDGTVTRVNPLNYVKKPN